MLQLFYKKDGAVTIFLILILVPVLALTGIFIELSRVEQAKSVLATSADLALNTALTNYDSLLKEYYGLMGSAQNTSDTVDVAKEYFQYCINSQKIDESELDVLYKKVGNIANNTSDLLTGSNIVDTPDEKIANLLQIQVAEDGLKVEAIKDANLANPVFLESQIVEFMKYRAPVELVTGLFQRIKSQAKNVENLQKDRELQEKEKETYEAENELLQRLYDVYREIKAYNSMGINAEYIQKMNTDIGGTVVKDLYEQIHYRAVKRYLNITPEDSFFQTFKNEIIYLPGSLVKNSKTYTSADLGRIKSELSNALKCIKDFEVARETLSSKLDVFSTGLNYNGAMTDVLQYSIQIYRKDGVEQALRGYFNAVRQLWSNYAVIAKMHDNAISDEELKAALEGTTINMYQYQNYNDSRVTNALNGRISQDTDTNLYEFLSAVYQYYYECETHNKIMKQVETPNNNDSTMMGTLRVMVYAAKTQSYLDEVVGSNSDDSLRQLWDLLYGYQQTIEEAKGHLATIRAMVEGTGKYAGGGSLYDLANTYSANLNAWNEAADYSDEDGSYCKDSKERSQKEITEKKGISGEDITNFHNRIINMENYFSGVSSYIKDDTKYGDVSVFMIAGLQGVNYQNISSTGFIDAAGKLVSADEISGIVDTAGLENLAKSKFQFTYGGQSLQAGNDNHPDLEQSKPKLYQYLQSKFVNGETEETKQNNAKAKYNKYKDDPDAKDEITYSEETDNTIMEIINLVKEDYPSGFTGQANGVSLFEAIITLASSLFKDFDGTLKNARDKLYVTEYCMKMFSYASYENELKIKYMKDHDIKLDEIEKLSKKSAIGGNLVQNLVNQAGINDQITSLIKDEDPNNQENKSLTNKPINSDNNFAYQREIEYILFGGSNASNIRNVKQELFKVRYAFNIIPGYKLFWGDKIIKSISAAVSSATMGIVPEPLVRVVMILLLVGLESQNDVGLLIQGIPVGLLKYKDEDWVCNPSKIFEMDLGELAGEIVGGSDPVTTDKTDAPVSLQYSDYLTLLLYFQLTSGDEQKVDNVFKRIGDVIQANMSKKIYKTDNYKLSNCATQYSLNYTALVKPLVLHLGIYNAYDTTSLTNSTQWRTIQEQVVRGY